MTSATPEPPRFWEPGATLAVGDRVRVRLSGECPGWNAGLRVGFRPHDEHWHGREGQVAVVVDDPMLLSSTVFDDGHRFALRSDDAEEWFARIELVRLADDAGEGE